MKPAKTEISKLRKSALEGILNAVGKSPGMPSHELLKYIHDLRGSGRNPVYLRASWVSHRTGLKPRCISRYFQIWSSNPPPGIRVSKWADGVWRIEFKELLSE